MLRYPSEERGGADMRRSGGQEGVLKVTLEAAEVNKVAAIPAAVPSGEFMSGL